MDCQHCEKNFSDISEFEAHSLWHTERQAQLRRQARKYRTDDRPHSVSTHQSSSSNSDGSALCSPESTATVESLSSQLANHSTYKSPTVFSEDNVPDSDFNFGTLALSTPINSRSLPIIKTLEDVVARFPAFEIENPDDHCHTNRDYKCADCEAIFSTQKDCDLHNQSRFCPGSAAIAFALFRDVRQPGGYRIDKKYLPFNGEQSIVKCQKCNLGFSNRVLKKVHERSHSSAQIECLHCLKAFSTTTELESHYQWHDDMEHRHHRDRCRRKLPGLKLQTKSLSKRQSKTGVGEFGRKSIFLAHEDLTSIPENPGKESRDHVNDFESEKELVAISFVSPEDLERIHAPNGFFREVQPSYLQPQKEIPRHHVADALDALEGRPPESQGSSCNSTSTEKEDPLSNTLKSDDHLGALKMPSAGLQKRSSIRSFFRRTRSEPQLESNLKRRASFRKNSRKNSATNEGLILDGRLMLSAVLQRVSTAANKGDLKAVRKECDRLMAMMALTTSDSESSTIPVQAFNFPEGTLIQDTAGNLRYISSETVNEITSALRHTPAASWAKTKVSVLSTRAYLSTQVEEYEDAFWCYRQVLHLLRQYPMLFPDVIWHAAILSNLAHLSARLKRSDDEQKYYLKALAISYNRYGRRDLNNINFLRALAVAFEKNSQTSRAAEVYKRSLFARMEISGPGDHETLMAMQELASVYVNLGCLEVAKLLYEQCLGGFETQLGLDHKITLLIVDRICDIYIQLQSPEEALAMYVRAFPHLRSIYDPDKELPRKWLSRYIQHTQNFDFPEEVQVFLQSYRSKPSEKNLWVLQSLARAYMLAGLLPEASETFDFVYNARRKLQGEHDPATLDALHGHCLALECKDSIDAAHSAYTNLIQLSLRSPNATSGKIRAMNISARLRALQERKKTLAGEKEAWSLQTTGPCGTCKYQTSLLCAKCHISRFCCEACRDLASRSHDPRCHPSVTLCQSRSVTAIPTVPPRIEQQVLDRLSSQTIRKGLKATIYRVSNRYTFHYDPRNFTTFRLKFNSLLDTFVSFNPDADIRFAILDPSPAPPSNVHQAPERVYAAGTAFLHPPARADGSAPSSERTSEEICGPLTGEEGLGAAAEHFSWTTPRQTETLLLPKGKDVYLLVAPGEGLFREMVGKRRGVRMADSEALEALEVPDEGLVRFFQGLVLEGGGRERGMGIGGEVVTKRRFAYLVEVES